MEQLVILVALFITLGSSLDLQHHRDNFKVQTAVKSNFMIEYGRIDDHKIEQRADSLST